MRRIAALLAALALVSIPAQDLAVCAQDVSVASPMTHSAATAEAPPSNEHDCTPCSPTKGSPCHAPSMIGCGAMCLTVVAASPLSITDVESTRTVAAPRALAALADWGHQPEPPPPRTIL